MAEFALSAAFKAIRARLSSGSEVWGSRVYPTQAPSGAELPYAIFDLNAGGDTNLRERDDAEYVMLVKVVASTMATAMIGASRIAALLNNAGFQDNPSSYLNGGTDWTIAVTSQEQSVYFVENVDNTVQVYHAGHLIRLTMEANS